MVKPTGSLCPQYKIIQINPQSTVFHLLFGTKIYRDAGLSIDTSSK